MSLDVTSVACVGRGGYPETSELKHQLQIQTDSSPNGFCRKKEILCPKHKQFVQFFYLKYSFWSTLFYFLLIRPLGKIKRIFAKFCPSRTLYSRYENVIPPSITFPKNHQWSSLTHPCLELMSHFPFIHRTGLLQITICSSNGDNNKS